MTRGERIRRTRNLQKLRQADLSEATGVSIRTIGRIEKGYVDDSSSLAVLERHLGIEQHETSPELTVRGATRLELLHELVTREVAEQRRQPSELHAPRPPDEDLDWPSLEGGESSIGEGDAAKDRPNQSRRQR